MSRADDTSTLLLVVLGLVLLGKAGGALDELKGKLKPALPKGSRHPGEGDLREVPRVRTALDPKGFPRLMHQAASIVDSWEGDLAERLREYVHLEPAVVDLDPDLEPMSRLLAAQVSAETRQGRAIYGFNVGNIHVSRGDYWTHPDTPGERFGEFLYPLQGAVAMIVRIKRLWPHALLSARYGPAYARQYVYGLSPPKGLRYYTAPREEYVRGLEGQLKRFGWG
jgi:hypothetical protein